jgi:hypothetical protein
VQLGSKRCGAVVALAMAVALTGCADVDFDTAQAWFAKPLDVLGTKSGGYTYSELQEAKRQRQIGANEMIDSSGACPPAAAPQPPPASGNQAATSALPPDTASLLGSGVALGMSECEVVYRAGQPTAVVLGKNPNGDRTAVLTYTSGPRPGVYHFERGALMQMDRVEEPAAQPQIAKKKSAKSNKPPKKNDQT